MGGQSNKGGQGMRAPQQVSPEALDELRSQYGAPQGAGYRPMAAPPMRGELNPETGINDHSTANRWGQAGQAAMGMMAPRMMEARRQMQRDPTGQMQPGMPPQPQGQMPGQRPSLPQIRPQQRQGGGGQEAMMQMLKMFGIG